MSYFSMKESLWEQKQTDLQFSWKLMAIHVEQKFIYSAKLNKH